MTDIHVAVIDFKGIENQISGCKAVIRNSQVVFYNKMSLGSCRIGTIILKRDTQLALDPVSKGAAVKIPRLVPKLLAVGRAKFCQPQIHRCIPCFSWNKIRIYFHRINGVI